MTSYTANQHLPYPDATDPLSKFPAQTKALAEAIETAMQATYAEPGMDSAHVVPFSRASLQLDTTIDLSSGSALIPFDSVDHDTDNMWNMDRTVYGPFVQTSGYYEIGVYVSAGPTNATGTDGLLEVTVIPGPTAEFSNGDGAAVMKWDGGSGNANTSLYVSVLAKCTASADATLNTIPTISVLLQKFGTFSGSHINDQIVTFMSAWMIKVRDL